MKRVLLFASPAVALAVIAIWAAFGTNTGWTKNRVQETHTVLLHLLWDQVHVALGEDDVL